MPVTFSSGGVRQVNNAVIQRDRTVVVQRDGTIVENRRP